MAVVTNIVTNRGSPSQLFGFHLDLNRLDLPSASTMWIYFQIPGTFRPQHFGFNLRAHNQTSVCVCVSDKVVSEGVVCDKVVCGEWAAEAGEGGEVADGSAQQKQPAGGKTALAVVRFLQFYVAGAVAP